MPAIETEAQMREYCRKERPIMKKFYEAPEAEVVQLTCEDVILTSVLDENIEIEDGEDS